MNNASIVLRLAIRLRPGLYLETNRSPTGSSLTLRCGMDASHNERVDIVYPHIESDLVM